MKSIIPYDENMIKNGGAFISPNGKIIFVHGKHEEVAYKLCNGTYYDFLSDVKNNSSSYYYQHFDEFKRKYNF